MTSQRSRSGCYREDPKRPPAAGLIGDEGCGSSHPEKPARPSLEELATRRINATQSTVVRRLASRCRGQMKRCTLRGPRKFGKPEVTVSQPHGDDLRMIRQSRIHHPDPERTRRTLLGSTDAFITLL